VVGLHALERRLSGDDPAEVLYCMELLDEADYPYLERVMSQLLRHPVPAIRVAALQCLERRRLAGASAAVSAALAEETEPSVRAAALGVLAMADPAGVAERLHRAAETEAPQVRVAAVAALLRYGGEKETGAARERLREMAFSTNVEDRLLAAQAIGEVGVKDLHFAVGRLLRDDDVAVCRAALKAAGQLDVAELWPRVIQRLVRPDTARAAATALIEAGPTAMPFLLAAFATPTTPRALRLTIVRLCGRIKETDGIELLLRSLNYPDAEVRRQTLRALDACRYRANDALAEQMPQLLAREVAAGAWITAAQLDVRELDLAPHVLRTFTGELEFVRERALLLLSLVYDSRTIMRCTGLILDADQSRRAYALEILDNVLPHAVKATLLPLLDDLPPERRLAALEGAVHYERLPARERLAALVARPLELCNPWSRACWIHAAGTLGGEECHTALLEASNSPSPLVAETAAWALGELAERERAAATAARTGASV
jgi:HEAT repeat protein